MKALRFGSLVPRPCDLFHPLAYARGSATAPNRDRQGADLAVITLLVLSLVLAATAWAADVTGKWVAQVPARNGQTREAVFNLKAAGGQLTGTVSSPRGERQISEGKIDGDAISFTVVVEFNGNSMKFFYKGKVAGDEIKFTREREGGPEGPREFTAKRSS